MQTSKVDCINLFDGLSTLAHIFLWASLVLAISGVVVEIIVKLAPIFSSSSYPAPRTGPTPPDPVKLLDALKNLIDAIAKAPTWFAMFLAGLGLLWVLTQVSTTICK